MKLIASSESSSSASIQTTCPYCGVGCGVSIDVEENTISKLAGRDDHPANHGRLCVKGSSLHETISHDGRLLFPKIHGRRASFDDAMALVSEQVKQIVAEHGPDAFAFYLSGQLLTEDYYVANKLIKGFIGTANIDTNSRLCMASAVVAHKRAFGADSVPGCYEDMEKTDVLFFVGSNAAYAHPIVFQRIAKAKQERGTKIVVLDPRRTATCDIADIHLPIRPGSDAYFYNGLLAYLADNKALDNAFIEAHCDNFDAALAIAQQQVPTVEAAAELCDVDIEPLRLAYEWFAQNPKVVTVFSQGINQSSSGVDKGNAIINCHLATGKIGKEGAVPFSITGQPNAMGGREVGGLANQLAAHMGFAEKDVQLVEEFWQAPNMARKEGMKAVDLFDAMHEGKIKAVWIMGTNPVVSMPNANKVREALEKCPLVVVSECMEDTDTARTADVVFPASTWGEKQGMVTNSERTISLQKGFMAPPGEAKHDWQIICAFAKALGYGEAFDYEHMVDVFREHAALSEYRHDEFRTRAFHIPKLKHLSKQEYLNFTPKRWPIADANPQGTQRLFEDGKFFTENQRAKFIAVEARLPVNSPKPKQFVMNTGRVRDQWHTMTRTGKTGRLLSHVAEPYIQVHPRDAERLSVQDGELLRAYNLNANYIGRVKVSDDQRLGEVFMPIHWNDIFSSNGRAGALIDPVVDPLSGQPEFKQVPVQLEKYSATMRGFLALHTSLESDVIDFPGEYWARVTHERGRVFTFADKSDELDCQAWLKQRFDNIDDWIEVKSPSDYRSIGFIDGKVGVVLAYTSANQIPDFAWLASQLGEKVEASERFTLLSAVPAEGGVSPGAIVCSCFQVGENQIIAAIQEGVASVEALGKQLKCGTNCGSCIPELSALIDHEQKRPRQDKDIAV